MPARATVHPRVCGELFRSCSWSLWMVAGSSPRVRGTLLGGDELSDAASRFIPACAGNSADVKTRCQFAAPVHPRVCGELSSHLRAAMVETGRRFIPACAGNSRAAPASMRSGRLAVHPRVCGELALDRRVLIHRAGRFIPACAGNSPVPLDARPRLHVRFIPACAGNSRVHPARGCGTGSSPRVRGTRLRPETSSGSRGRFIPACAGNSHGCDARAQRVHADVGSSPRVRGTP